MFHWCGKSFNFQYKKIISTDLQFHYQTRLITSSKTNPYFNTVINVPQNKRSLAITYMYAHQCVAPTRQWCIIRTMTGFQIIFNRISKLINLLLRTVLYSLFNETFLWCLFSWVDYLVTILCSCSTLLIMFLFSKILYTVYCSWTNSGGGTRSSALWVTPVITPCTDTQTDKQNFSRLQEDCRFSIFFYGDLDLEHAHQ